MFRNLLRRLPSAALMGHLKIRCLTVFRPLRKFQLHCFHCGNLPLLGHRCLFWFLQTLPFSLRGPGCLPWGSWKSRPSSGGVGKAFVCLVPRLSTLPAAVAVLEVFLVFLGRYPMQSVVITVPSSGLPVWAFSFLLLQGFRVSFVLFASSYLPLVLPFSFFFLFLVLCWSCGLSCLLQRFHSFYL